MFRIGVDIGGTFTDFAIWRRESDGYAEIGSHKLASTRPNYAQAVIQGIEDIAAEYGIAPEHEALVVHGTTVSTNAIIERSQPPVGLLTTAGFRDILEIARLRLDKPVDLFNRRPPPLVERSRVFEVVERIAADGSIDTRLDEASVLSAAEEACRAGAGGLAISFLHSYRNPEHERRAAEIVRERFPEIDVVASHEVWPQQSEYERTVLTLMNLYVKGLMSDYLNEIAQFLSERLPRSRLLVMKSNGGAMSSAEAAQLPVHTLLSGPAAGVTGATELSRMLDAGDVLTMDMGGTSTDVSLVQSSRPSITAQAEVGDFPLLLPVTAIEALGAGGGSLIWLDQGVLKVGPKSAGSTPGPACYDQGGTSPTLTDAYLLCGYLPPAGLLDGKLPLSRPAAEAAFGRLAEEAGAETDALADAAIAVATSNMQARILPFLARLGVEPSELSLMIFGGAGGIHGPVLATELGLRRVLVPRTPSVFCAFGCLVADLIHDSVRSIRGRPLDASVMLRDFAELAEEGANWISSQGGDAARADHFAEMRYAAQAFTIPVDVTGQVDRCAGLKDFLDAFHTEHQRLFDHSDTDATVAIDELRTRTHGGNPKPHAGAPERARDKSVAPTSHRDLRLAGEVMKDRPVYARKDLPEGWEGHGPAIIEQDVATILIPPGYTARVGELGDLWLISED